MRESKARLMLEDLNVDSFSTSNGPRVEGAVVAMSQYQHTVLYHTEQVSCYNSDCGTCGGADCWA